MDNKELLEKAQYYIMLNDDNLYVCEYLQSIEEESKYCAENCENYV